jgi:diacylglycerol O-acyltransferase-1
VRALPQRGDEDLQSVLSGASPGVSHSSRGTSAALSDGEGGEEVDSGAGRWSPADAPATDGAPPRRRRHHRRGGGGGGGGKDVMQACSPVHMERRFSLLSSDRIAFSNQSGLLTLMFIVLVVTNFRLILENIIKYGLRFNPLTFMRAALTPAGNLPLLLCWPGLALSALAALGIERAAARRARGARAPGAGAAEPLVGLLNAANIVAALAAPCYVIHATSAEPLPAFTLTLAATVVWLKLVSYAHVNWALRRARAAPRPRPSPGERGSGVEPAHAEHLLAYPENLSLGNLAYFLVAPTLCYQLSYPRTPRVRPRWVLRRVALLCAALGMMLFILEQYIEPTIDNSLRPLQEMVSVQHGERAWGPAGGPARAQTARAC